MAIQDTKELCELVHACVISAEGYNGTEKRVGLAIGPVWTNENKEHNTPSSRFNVFDPTTGITYMVIVRSL